MFLFVHIDIQTTSSLASLGALLDPELKDFAESVIGTHKPIDTWVTHIFTKDLLHALQAYILLNKQVMQLQQIAWDRTVFSE